MQDQRTIAEIWFDDGTDAVAGYLWVVFYDIKDYGLSKLHEKAGFNAYRVLYEKKLD
jgi:hypothetical protein